MSVRPIVSPRTAVHVWDIGLGTELLMDSTFNHEELARGDEQLARLEEQLSKLGLDTARNPPLLQPRMSRFRFAFPGGRLSLGGWVLRGFAGLLLVACIGVAAVAWRRTSDNDAAKAAPAQP